MHCRRVFLFLSHKRRDFSLPLGYKSTRKPNEPLKQRPTMYDSHLLFSLYHIVLVGCLWVACEASSFCATNTIYPRPSLYIFFYTERGLEFMTSAKVTEDIRRLLLQMLRKLPPRWQKNEPGCWNDGSDWSVGASPGHMDINTVRFGLCRSVLLFRHNTVFVVVQFECFLILYWFPVGQYSVLI